LRTIFCDDVENLDFLQNCFVFCIWLKSWLINCSTILYLRISLSGVSLHHYSLKFCWIILHQHWNYLCRISFDIILYRFFMYWLLLTWIYLLVNVCDCNLSYFCIAYKSILAATATIFRNLYFVHWFMVHIHYCYSSKSTC